MTYTTWKIEHFDDLNSVTTPDNVINEFSQPNIIVSTGDGRDSFSFKVRLDSDEASFLGVRDKVKISRTIEDASFSTSDVLMVGAVNKVPETKQQGEFVVNVSGNNFSKTLMDAVVFVDASNKTIPEAIEEALNSIQNYSKDFGVSWNSNNPSVKSNGDDFPVVGEKWYYKSMRSLLKEYSNDAKTGDGDYYWFVDVDNTLVWRKETGDVVDVISNSFLYKNIELSRDSDEVINFVRAKGDTLPTGGVVEAQYIDFGSAGKHGLRYKAVQDKSKLVATNHNDVMSQLGASDVDVLPGDISGFSYPLSSSITPWEESQVINSDEEYLNSLKAFAQNELRAQAEKTVRENRNGYFEITMDILAKNNVFELGELYDMRIDGFPKKPMRVKEIQYTDTLDTVVFREDVPSV